MTTKKWLTKTLIMRGLQCPKNLYLHLHNPELAVVDPNLARVLASGNKVGEMAHLLYPTGVLVSEKSASKALDETKNLFHHDILFEAAILADNLYCRVDVLEKTPDGLSITEVKSSSEVKDYQIQDLAVQAYILQKAGHKLGKLYLCHVNKEYKNSDPISNFFIKVDQTEEVLALLPETEAKIIELQKIIESLPDIDIGPHCNKPFVCPFTAHCYKEKKIGPTSILTFPRLNTKWDFYRAGKKEISDLKDSDLKTDNQKAFLKKFNAKFYFDKEEIAKTLKSWKYPLNFLDFETFSMVIPPYPNTKPNAKIVFQFSLFVLNNKDSAPVLKCSYIPESLEEDPRRKVADALVENIGTKGSIVVYNQSFEKSRIEELAKLFPDLKDQLLALLPRIKDLFEIIRDHVYHRDFKGSWSIKSVTPALLGKAESYDELNVHNGLGAQEAFLTALETKILSPEVRNDLLEYCNKDVLGMIDLLTFLREKLE